MIGNRRLEVFAGGATRTAAKAGVVVIILFLVFGMGFVGVVLDETPESETTLRILLAGFGVIWIVGCGAILRFYVRILRGQRIGAPDSLLHIEESSDGRGADFDDRLRKVEVLHRDGLLSEAEYMRKREEIVNEKW